MIAKHLGIALIVFLALATGCSEDPQTIYVEVEVPCDDVPSLPDTGSPDTADTSGPEDVPEDTAEEDVETTDIEEGNGVEVDGNRMKLDPAELDGLFVYGLGVEPGTALASVGNTIVGVIAIPALVEVGEDEVVIRAVEAETLAPVPGEDGVIEVYPAETLEDGRVSIDFSSPKVALEVQLWQNCVYRQAAFIPLGEPEFADGLLTWFGVEHYKSQSCGNGGLPESVGVNVHFLRRVGANPSFLPRAQDPESPFGFFLTPYGDVTYLNRMPYVGGQYEDGQVIYYVSNEFPEHLRPIVHQVVESWNDALEEMAGNRPLAVVEEEPTPVAWDPRYRVIQWDASEGKGAIAPFIEDPFTGEMFETDIIVWLANLDEVVQKYQTFFTENPDVPIEKAAASAKFSAYAHTKRLPRGWNDARGLAPRVLRRRAFERKPFGMAALHEIYQRVGKTLTEEELELYVVADFLTHEIGHNLGLRHNFKASIDRDLHPPEQTATSCMDYVVGMITPGTYDRDAMGYGYGSGPKETGYVYCTDEDVDLDPGCTRWDFGHPLAHAITVFEKLMADHPAGTPTDEIQWKWQAEEWGKRFNTFRLFVNSEYEGWDDEKPLSAIEQLVTWVLCAEDCETHIFFRQQFALYTLYTKFSHQDEWQDFPALGTEQAEWLLSTYFDLILDPAQPMALKETIINKLPTSNVEGAPALLNTLKTVLEEMEEPGEMEQELLNLVQDALDS